MTIILGISAFYHDSAAALVRDGEIVAAAQEERFTRKKGDSSFPVNAIDYCLREAGIAEEEIDHVVYYENPIVHFERLTTIYHLSSPHSLKSYLMSFPAWITDKLWMDRKISRELNWQKGVEFCDHHLSHAASAFFPSPFQESAILTIDGVGEWSTTTFGLGVGNNIELLEEIRFPNSVGLLYSAFTYFTGFRINSGEYKLMGLAPYGEPKYVNLIYEKLIQLDENGAIKLNQRYFDYIGGLTMTNSAFASLFGGPPRIPETEITQREMDLAASIQTVLNEIILKMAKYVKKQTGASNLVLAGGVALNVVSMGLLARENIFEKIWIQPAAGDSGGALGAALWFWYQVLDNKRIVNISDAMMGSFLGPEIAASSISDDKKLISLGAKWEVMTEVDLQYRVAELISTGKVIAIARGRMEWGPRSLGNRSILGDARSPDMQSHMNLKIKFRESFRPFAPMVLAEDAAEYFNITQESPYMLLACPVLESHRLQITNKQKKLWGIEALKVPRSDIPAVTHIDYSARLQTVDYSRNPFMYGVLASFKQQTGCGVMINTSFNVRGEPIVNSLEDAYYCFMATDIDYLVLGNRLLNKEDQINVGLSRTERNNWLRRFQLD